MRSNRHVATTSNNSYNKCSVCQDTSHKIFYCPQLLKMTVKGRAEVVKKNKLCFNCLKPECHSFKCTSRACLRCNNKHNTLLHIENYKSNANKQNNKGEESDSSSQEQENKISVQAKTTNNSNEEINESIVNCASVIHQPHVLLWTAKVHVKDTNGKLQVFRALLDNRSQSNFVTQQCISDLGLTATSRITKVSGVSALSSCSEAVITLQIMSRTSTFKQNLEFLVMKKITNDLPTSSIPVQGIKLPSGLTLADPEYYKSNKVVMLIGSECFSNLLQRGLIKLGNHRPTLHETALGWVVAGQLNVNYNTQNTASYLCTNSNCQATETINQAITKFWRVEEFKTDRLSTDEDIQCEQMYSATTSRNQYGRYIVKLPLRSDPSVLGDSFQEALRRFRQIEKRLQKDVVLQTNYNNFMNEYLSLGHMQMVEDITQSKEVRYFLPHHPVFREANTTTKLRVVFDASMKTDGGKGLSLNDILLVGPVVQDDLFSVLIRFRMHSIVFTADIIKMYRQIQVHHENTSLQSILWRSSPHQEIKIYELNTVTYGTAAAPYLATRTLN